MESLAAMKTQLRELQPGGERRHVRPTNGRNHSPVEERPKLAVAVFDRNEDGDLRLVLGPAEQQSEARAVRTAKRWRPSTPVPSRGLVKLTHP